MSTHQSLSQSAPQTQSSYHDEMTVTAQRTGDMAWEREAALPSTGSALVSQISTVVLQVLDNYTAALVQFEKSATMPDPDKMTPADIWQVLYEWTKDKVGELARDCVIQFSSAAAGVDPKSVSAVYKDASGLLEKLDKNGAAAKAARDAWELADYTAHLRMCMQNEKTRVVQYAAPTGQRIDAFLAQASDSERSSVLIYLQAQRDRLTNRLVSEETFGDAYANLVGRWSAAQDGQIDVVMRGGDFAIEDAAIKGVAEGDALLHTGQAISTNLRRTDQPILVRWFPGQDTLSCVQATVLPDGTVTNVRATNSVHHEQVSAFVEHLHNPAALVML